MTDRLTEILRDLDAESAQLDSWVRELDAQGWSTATPANGWTIAHQIAHLHWTDDASERAVTGGAAFGELIKEATSDPTGYVDHAAERLVSMPPDALLAAWRDGRARLADALRGVPDGTKIAWFGPPMSPASMATARLMETWAHGHDVAEALDIRVPRTARVKHVCHLGVRTRRFAYAVRGLEVPTTDVHVRLDGPGGEVWTWGPEDAAEHVTGTAWDFALLATRRRHLDDVDVRADGTDAEQWLTIVQAFAGLPGREPVASGRSNGSARP